MKFSIVITSYNQPDFIRGAVNSVIAQSFSDFEIVVVDDASHDNSIDVLLSFGERIRLIRHQKNQGAAVARNTGASNANGEYLVFLDGDDLLLPWALDVYARIITQKNAKIILGKLFYFSGNTPNPTLTDFGNRIQFALYPELMKKDRTYRCCASSIVMDRNVFNAVGGWSSDLFPSEIDDLTVKLGYSGLTAHILSHPTVAYREHEGQTMNQIHRFIQKMCLVVEKEKRGEYPGGRQSTLERYAYIGGPVFYWLSTGIKAKLFKDTIRLFLAGWPMVLVAIWSRLLLRTRKRQPVETIIW